MRLLRQCDRARPPTRVKMKIFLAVTSLHSTYGGPAHSVSRLALALADAGLEVGLWTPDGSAAEAPLLPAESTVVRLTGSADEALDRFGTPDVVHDNGIWLWHHHRLAERAARRGTPRVVSTRGMLDPWPLNHKWLKKRLAWYLYQQRDLRRAHVLHVTSAAEERSVQSLALGVPVRVIPNGVEIPDLPAGMEAGRAGRESRNGERTALFLGRLYPIKGLPMLIEAWRRVRPAGWRLRIAGPDEGGHRAELEQAVSEAGLGSEIEFVGSREGLGKAEAYSNAELFILPTHSENFGMAIGEAFAHGLPVLTTTGAPWPMLAERGCGWWVAPTVEGISGGLRQATLLDTPTLRAMGAKGREMVFAAEYRWEHIARRFAQLYEGLKGS